jgi:ABC-type sugar transport system ATPase subunit
MQASDGRHMAPASPVLDVRGLCVRIDGWQVLSDIELTVMEGQFHGVGGEHAAMTALVDVLAGEAAPDAGLVSLHGVSCDPTDVASTRRSGLRVARAEDVLDRLADAALGGVRVLVVSDLAAMDASPSNGADEARLHEALGRLVGRGVAVLFVTVRPREIRQLCDTLTLVFTATRGVVPLGSGVAERRSVVEPRRSAPALPA